MPYWLTQRHLKSPQHKRKIPSIQSHGKAKHKEPDGYFALRFPQKQGLAHHFYEEDSGTETQKQWIEKIRAYLNFKQSGASYAHFGCHNFRVLTKTTSETRMTYLKQWTQKAGGDSTFWFTTREQIDIWQPQTFLDSIWNIASASGKYPLTLTESSKIIPNTS